MLGIVIHTVIVWCYYHIRKLLVSDYNELKARQSEDQDEEETIEKEDPVILKLKLA